MVNERLNAGELRLLLTAMRALPFEHRPEGYYALMTVLENWLALLS